MSTMNEAVESVLASRDEVEALLAQLETVRAQRDSLRADLATAASVAAELRARNEELVDLLAMARGWVVVVRDGTGCVRENAPRFIASVDAALSASAPTEPRADLMRVAEAVRKSMAHEVSAKEHPQLQAALKRMYARDLAAIVAEVTKCSARRCRSPVNTR